MKTFPLEELYEAAKLSLTRQHTRHRQGDDDFTIFLDELHQLQLCYALILAHTGDCRPRYALDWENIGLVMNRAFLEALNRIQQGESITTASAGFNQAIGELLKEKIHV